MTNIKIEGRDILGAIEHDANRYCASGELERLQFIVEHQGYLLKEILNVLTPEQRLDVYQAMTGDVEHYSEVGVKFTV
jgi:hypothetical protein